MKRSSRDDRGRVKDYNYREEQRGESDRVYRSARDEEGRRRDSSRPERDSLWRRAMDVFRRGDGHQ